MLKKLEKMFDKINGKAFYLCAVLSLLGGCAYEKGELGYPINDLTCTTVIVKDRLTDYFNQVPKRTTTTTEGKEKKDFLITTDWYEVEPSPPRRSRYVRYFIDIEENGDKSNVRLSWEGRAKGIREEKVTENIDIENPKEATVLLEKIRNICGS